MEYNGLIFRSIKRKNRSATFTGISLSFILRCYLHVGLLAKFSTA